MPPPWYTGNITQNMHSLDFVQLYFLTSPFLVFPDHLLHMHCLPSLHCCLHLSTKIDYKRS
ncbi:hypothetical protein RchiOBHm_Chr6g0293311 [Rosa chinensis]|uniref:Uncharacterized protein n=1 Tax=Rosa chinensis TaxID=74649 RepID=A0A2P6PWK4_ROSCH|nr:hypothetical protein RchiOBHm_Chr6g0293311 [Rosa chinensis]